MKTLVLVFLLCFGVMHSICQAPEKFWINYFKAIPLNSNESKFKVGVKQLGLFYINPDIEHIVVESNDTLFLKGKLHNENLDVSIVDVYLLKKNVKRSFPFLKKREIYQRLYKIADVNANGQFEARICIKNESLLFIGGGNSTLDHIGLSISENQ